MALGIWTDERVEQLRTLFSDPEIYSNSEIATKLDCGLSRNAVIGKISRLGLTRFTTNAPGRKTVTKRFRRADGTKQAFNARPKITPEPFVIQCTEVVPLNIAFSDLQDGDCRFPYGDNPGTMTYCGLPSLTGLSWCRGHFCIVTTPTPARKPPQPFVSQAGAPSRFGGGVAA
jgi:GcrA cell cycle regulator